MTKAILDGDPPLTLTVRRSRAARRLSLRVSGIDGKVTLTMPPQLSTAEALRFAAGNRAWLDARLTERPDAVSPRVGDTWPLQGRMLPLVEGPGRAARLLPDAIALPPGRPAGPALAAACKDVARQRAAALVAAHAATLGRSHGRLSLRDTRSRWGSCTAEGNIMLSWRLVLAPPEIFDYVAAHEVAHLRHMDHSRAFWATVAGLCPAFERHRRWLRDHGPDLHRWRFCD